MSLFNKKKEEEKEEKTSGKAKDAVAVKPVAKKRSMKDLYDSKGDVAEVKEAEGKAGKAGNAYRVLVRPLITEKVAKLSAQNKYAFEIFNKTNKIEVAKAIKEVYGVKPTAVNIVSVKGKRVRSGKVSGRRKDWKKAIVTLSKGQEIKVYEGV